MGLRMDFSGEWNDEYISPVAIRFQGTVRGLERVDLGGGGGEGNITAYR